MLDITFNIQNYANSFNISYSLPQLKLNYLYYMHIYTIIPSQVDVVMCTDIELNHVLSEQNRRQRRPGWCWELGISVSIKKPDSSFKV